MIDEKLIILDQNIKDAYDALEAKGATMPEARGTSQLVDTINSISGGGGSSKRVVLKCYANRSTSWGSRVLTDIDDNELDVQQLRELIGDGYNFSVIPVDTVDGEEMPTLIMTPIAVVNIDEGNGMMIMLQSCFHKIDDDSDFLTSYELIIELSDLTTFYIASLNTNTIPSIEYVDSHIISVINTEV